jgi:putative peptidoglycan lipid II flippase
MTTTSTNTESPLQLTDSSTRGRWAILGSIFTISILTLIVKMVALGKDLVAAHQFGTSDAMDAFLMAFLIPALIPMIMSQSLPSALVPAYAVVRELDGSLAADRMAVQAMWLYALKLGIAVAIAYLAQPVLIPLLTHKFSPEKQVLCAALFRNLLPFAFCYGLSFGFISWLQANKRFAISSIAPAVIPLTTLLFLTQSKQLGIWAFIYGTNVGSLLLVLVLAFAANSTSEHPLLRPGKVGAASKHLFRESIPLLASGLLVVGLPFLDQWMAGWMESGSVAVFSYSEKICSIVLSIGAGSAAQALLPYLTDHAGKRDWLGLKSTTLRYSAIIIGASLPVVAIFWIAAPNLVQLLLERGSFGQEDTARVATVLRFHALQIPFYIAAVMASKVILAMRAGKFMLFTTLMNLALNAILNTIFMRFWGVAGLALATTGVYLLSAIMLYAYMFIVIPRRIAADALASAQPA